MSSQNNPPETPRRSLYSRYRLPLRLVGLAIVAAAAVILYRGIRAHFVLPECDSRTARETLAKVLKELRLEPVRYAPIKTISSTKDKVVCNAVMPLPDGATVVADYTFFWQGSRPNMRYSIRRAPAQSSSLGKTGGAPRIILGLSLKTRTASDRRAIDPAQGDAFHEATLVIRPKQRDMPLRSRRGASLCLTRRPNMPQGTRQPRCAHSVPPAARSAPGRS